MGASGAGKSTVLRAIAALEPFDCGIDRRGRRCARTRSRAAGIALRVLRRSVGMVFQSHSLFEHLTGAGQRHARADARARLDARARRRAMRSALLASLGVAHRASALSATALRRRGAARGDRARARARSHAAADGRADLRARSAAARRPRARRCACSRARGGGCSSRRTTWTSRATGRTGSWYSITGSPLVRDQRLPCWAASEANRAGRARHSPRSAGRRASRLFPLSRPARTLYGSFVQCFTKESGCINTRSGAPYAARPASAKPHPTQVIRP